MRNAFLQKIRWSVIYAQQVPSVGMLCRKASQVITRKVGSELAKVPGVEAVFLRHSRPTSPGFIVGHSDLDLTVVFNDRDAEDPGRVKACFNELEMLSRLYPIVQMQDARFMSQRELTQFSRNFPSPFDLLYQPEDWLLIGGKDVRSGIPHSLPPRYVPWHPEFNRWWEHVIQHHALLDKRDLDRGYMRTLYRCALKNQLNLQAARGTSVTKPNCLIEDELSTVAFNGDQDLKDILLGLKKQNFWEKHPEEKRARILLSVLRAVGDFFSRWPAHTTIHKETENRLRSAEEPHHLVYKELESKIKNHPEIHKILRTAVAYPLPHYYPYFYKVDLVLREDLSLDGFLEGMRAIELCFGRKEFTVGKHRAEITLVLESVYRHPLFFLGSPHPFLLEHIQEFGTTVYGSPVTIIRGTLSYRDMINWCRIYLPCHMFSLRRRPEYSSPTLNFYQLASIRIFLECGDRLTDALHIRKAYLERFGKNDRDQVVLNYFLHGTKDQLDTSIYHDAFILLSREYDQLESLLAGC